MIRGFDHVVLLALGATSACAARSEAATLVGEIVEDVVDSLEMETYCSKRLIVILTHALTQHRLGTQPAFQACWSRPKRAGLVCQVTCAWCQCVACVICWCA